MKRTAIAIFMIVVFQVSVARAQGFKEVIDKLQAIEHNLDQLKEKQENDIRVMENRFASAETARAPQADNSSVERIDTQVGNLHNEMSRITRELSVLQTDVVKLRDDMSRTKSPAVSDEMIAELDGLIERINVKIETAEVSQRPVIAAARIQSAGTDEPKLSIKPYGYFKLDMAYDSARTNNGDYAFWVLDKGAGDEDSEFGMTARQTRLGFNLAYDGLGDISVTGRFELDFYGGGTENKNMPMMRHAFFKVNYGSYYLLAGQTSDVISPLFPSTVNYIVLWNCGNIGYRRPQIQVGNIVNKGFEVVWALARNIPGDVDNDGNDDGEDSSLPSVQARVSYKAAGLNVGVSGHYGVMEYTDTSGKDSDYSSYSVNVHASYAVTDAVTLQGEAFTGTTLNQYLGGIGQGFDYTTGKEIESKGGWIAGTWKAQPGLSLNLGYGTDLPEKDDKSILTRNENSCIFANASKSIAYNTTLALELSHWTTGYYDATGNETDTSDFRAQAAFILNF